MTSVNAFGRAFDKGKSLSEDYKRVICDYMLQHGAPRGQAHFKDMYSMAGTAAKQFCVSENTVVKIWTTFCVEGTFKSKQRGFAAGTRGKLSDQDIAYIEYLLAGKPSTTLGEITEKLKQYSHFPDGLSKHTVMRAVHEKLSTGRFSRKRITNVHQERFSDNNMNYSQAFIDELYSRNPHQIKYFDESGFKVPDSCNPTYGYAPIGVRAVEIHRYHQTPNVTLNLLIGTGGVEYFNTLQGASTGMDFLSFFDDASRNVNLNTGEPILMAGDTIVVDNCPTHHSQPARVLRNWLAQRGIDLIYTPVYSPDFNPVEFCFNKIKTCIKRHHYRDIFKQNIELGVHEVMREISASDCVGFYKAVGYLNL